jgi:DNA-binding transcriptional regulator LsrR (DeoR family)
MTTAKTTPETDEDGPLDLSDRQQQTALRASWLYYMEGQTQEQIARILGINRVRVNRILAAARDSGLVQVRINSRLTSCLELERILKDQYGIGEAFVVPTPADAEDVRRVVGHEGGRILSDRLHDNVDVAVGWGRTLRLSLQTMERRSIPGMEVVSLTGGLIHGSVMNSHETAMRLSDMFNAKCSYIVGPAFTDTEETRDMLLRQPMLMDAFAHARNADIAYMSVGGLDGNTTMAQLGLIGPDDIETLARAGAVGDLLSYWIDEHGNVVDHPLNKRVLALPPDDLKSIPSVILVTGGVHRYRAIRAALRKGVVSTLVTDEDTAALVTGRSKELP